MKKLFECEVCGKTYTDEESALNCEKRHAENALREKELKEKRIARETEIREAEEAYNKKVNDFYRDYKCLPSGPVNIGGFMDYFFGNNV